MRAAATLTLLPLPAHRSDQAGELVPRLDRARREPPFPATH
jgi:hypothetical protein